MFRRLASVRVAIGAVAVAAVAASSVAIGVHLGRGSATPAADPKAAPSASGVAPGGEAPVASTSQQGQNSKATAAPPDRPMLGITAYSVIVFAEPRDTAKRLGYLRLGTKVARSEEPVSKKGCPGGWYEIFPRGFVCAGPEATVDLESPILAAAHRRPDLRAALPYRYGFVRAVLPLYLKVPTKAEQLKSEFKLEEHLAWYEQNRKEVDAVKLGAWDVPLDDRGVPIRGKALGELGTGKNSLEVGLGTLFGGEGEEDPIPAWLAGGTRKIPNVSDFAVPEYAVFADRARRFTGLGLVGSFRAPEDAFSRRFAITTDLRLAPTTKLKPDTGSPFHGVELGEGVALPLAFVREQGATWWSIDGSSATRDGDTTWRSAVPLTGKQKKLGGERYVQTKEGKWLRSADLSMVLPPRSFPKVADAGEKWIEVSIEQQTLTMWEGHRPIYATLVSTGRKEYPTLLGEFRIENKHVTATMDSDESSSVGGVSPPRAVARRPSGEGPRGGDGKAKPAEKPAKAPGKGASDKAAAKGKPSGKPSGKPDGKPDGKGKKGDSAQGAKPGAKPTAKAATKPAAPAAPGAPIPTRGDGEYGVTKRRGEGTYQLRDVPYIQYFAAGQALHAAYWHDVFGKSRSHGCVNLSPIDAHRVFMWTEPAIAEGWHGMNTGEENGVGTTIIIHE